MYERLGGGRAPRPVGRLPYPWDPSGFGDACTPADIDPRAGAPYRRPPVPPIARALALATLSGVLYFVGFVGFDQWYLAPVCLAPLLLALSRLERARTALLVSWWMGFVTHLGGYYWVVHLLQEFAHLALPLAVLGYLLLCLGQGAILAAFGWLAFVLAKRRGLPLAVVAPVAFVAVEFAFPLLFPSYLANALAWTPWLTQIADLGGVLLVSLVLASTSAAVFELVDARLSKRPVRKAVPAIALALVVFDVGYGQVRMAQVDERDAAAEKLTVAIVQANVGAATKHRKAAEGVRRYRDMTDAAMALEGVDLVVWPESGLNRTVTSLSQNLTGVVATEVKTPMIVGALRAQRENGKRKVWNTSLAVEPGGTIAATYDKTVLLAFGEYVPGDTIFPGVYDLLPYTSHFERGTSVAPLPVGPWRLSTNICYEDILPRFVRDLMGPIDAEGTRPHAIVNVTNDSWYGPAEPPIHLALATFRTIEHRRWMIRSTATGISAFIDSSGRVRQRSAFEEAETLVDEVPMIAAGPTVYGVLGDWLGWLALAACAAGLLVPLRKKA